MLFSLENCKLEAHDSWIFPQLTKSFTSQNSGQGSGFASHFRSALHFLGRPLSILSLFIDNREQSSLNMILVVRPSLIQYGFIFKQLRSIYRRESDSFGKPQRRRVVSMGKYSIGLSDDLALDLFLHLSSLYFTLMLLFLLNCFASANVIILRSIFLISLSLSLSLFRKKDRVFTKQCNTGTQNLQFKSNERNLCVEETTEHPQREFPSLVCAARVRSIYRGPHFSEQFPLSRNPTLLDVKVNMQTKKRRSAGSAPRPPVLSSFNIYSCCGTAFSRRN